MKDFLKNVKDAKDKVINQVVIAGDYMAIHLGPFDEVLVVKSSTVSGSEMEETEIEIETLGTTYRDDIFTLYNLQIIDAAERDLFLKQMYDRETEAREKLDYRRFLELKNKFEPSV